MATTVYFEEEIKDQGGKETLFVEFGRSSCYSGSPIPGGTGVDSIYLTVEDKTVIMDRETARKFVEAAVSVGHYHGLLD
ncbi:hypothetical protein RGUI_1085 [Rhodovulum sp. P5]|uniref:hypothetical protein n=1 Tax=Rhodovulum sp. P5 TaxID=1564506 RepID=UPI0009C1D5F3|nr:hypothetical protein [Rhodovulum sp. P5]ARE39226.1 hypothetical protein RGUI_1085 [Rhodovulum sp. P5]